MASFCFFFFFFPSYSFFFLSWKLKMMLTEQKVQGNVKKKITGELECFGGVLREWKGVQLGTKGTH